MMGTAKYLSPEQVRGRKLDGRADLYSLGLVLYECLAGRVPFLGETDADTALARLQRDPTDLGRLRPTIPRGLVNLIHSLLSRNPNHRPATGAELRAALQRIADEPPPDLTPLGQPPGPVPSPVGPFITAPCTTRSRHRPPRRRRRPATGPGAAADPRRGHAAQPGRPRRPARPHARRRAAPARQPGPRPAVADRAVDGPRARPARRGAGRRPRAVGHASAVAATAARRVDDRRRRRRRVGRPAGGTGPAEIASVAAYDPDGDGEENDELARAALADGDPATNWRTVCYARSFMGGKQGVGLALTLAAPAAGTLSFDVVNAPYQVEVFASDAAAVPGRLRRLGPGRSAEAVRRRNPARSSVDVAAPARHLLIVFRELGRDPGCTAANPYRGAIGEIRFA